MEGNGIGPKMSKIIDVPGKINFHVAVDDEFHNVVLMMVGTNNSKKIRMLCAFDDLENIGLIISRLEKAKAEAEKLREEAAVAREAMKDARFLDTNVVDFIAWKRFAGIDLGPIGKTLDADEADGTAGDKLSDESVRKHVGTTSKAQAGAKIPTANCATAALAEDEIDPGPKAA